MTEQHGSTSVFTDDSGSRRRLLGWGTRAAIGALLLAGTAIVFSLVADVPLPGLPGPANKADNSAVQPESAPNAPLQPGAATSSPFGVSGSAGQTAGPNGTGRPGTGTPTGTPGHGTPPVAAPPTSGPTAGPPTTTPAVGTPTPTPKGNKGGSSADAPRATPTKGTTKTPSKGSTKDPGKPTAQPTHAAH